MARASPKPAGPSAVDLIEEAVHLLRRHPRELAGYFAAAGPFAVALLYFWAYVTWFAPPDGAVAAGALLLAVLFGWMKAGQHRFALRLFACRMGEEPPRWTARQWSAEIAAQFRLQASGAILVPLAALFAVPFGWIYAYYQSVTVLPPAPGDDTATRRTQAWEQALLWPAQNHWGLAILSGLWLMVFINLAVAFYLVPSLATRVFGLKTAFAISGWSYFNTTFLALVAVLTHLLVDPLIKTFYLLRVFHGRARHTGADLRLVLARERILRRRLASGLALLVVAAVLGLGPVARAGESALVNPGPQAAPVPVLNPALDRVLAQPEYRWRLRPLPLRQKEKEGIIKGFARSTLETITQILRTVYHWIQRASEWVSDLLPGGKKSGDKNGGDAAKAGAHAGDAFGWMAVLQLVSYLLLAAVAGLLIFVIWKVWAHNRAAVPLAAALEPAALGTPDLRDENVEASRLPADGWLDLARQQMAAGEWRLALRALFLATLARHAHEGLLSLAKFKTNLDYEGELQRRVHSRTVLVDEFRGRRRQFEAVWYGAAPASDALVRDWLLRMEGPV